MILNKNSNNQILNNCIGLVVVVVVFYYCDMGEDWYNCYTLKTSTQLTPRAIVGL